MPVPCTLKSMKGIHESCHEAAYSTGHNNEVCFARQTACIAEDLLSAPAT